MYRRIASAATALLLLAGLAACSGSSSESGGGGGLGAVTVTGDYGAEPTVEIGDLSGLGDEVEKRVEIEGAGPQITGDMKYAANVTLYDGATKQAQVPYSPLQQVLTATSEGIPAYLTEIFTEVASGSRVVAVVPPALLLESSTGAQNIGPAVVVADVVAVPDNAATGAEQAATQSLVTVADGEAGAPVVAIAPGAVAPTELVLDTRKLGEGTVVEEGDSVVVQYTGVLFPTGETFDSSWTRGTPAQFQTTGVVDGFAQALVGQRVGSQVIAVIPPALGYGDQESATIPANSTLVFVVDILATI